MPAHDDSSSGFGGYSSQPASAGDYRIDESVQPNDPEWDTFVACCEGGDILQTSLWGQVKAHSGWSPFRVVVRHNDRITGGFQMLKKRLIPGVNFAVVLRAPLNSTDDPAITELLLGRLQQACRRHRVQFLLAQLPHLQSSHRPGAQLPRTFYRSSLEYTVLATTVVDLEPEPDALLKKMRSKTRYNIQLGLRKGIEVREGGRADIAVLHSLLRRTGERQGFDPQDVQHFQSMWDILAPAGHLKIFFAELDGEPVSAMLAVAFGDTVVYKRGGWSGKHGNYHPNEVLHWQAMNWARSAGYRYYDFDGVDLPAARAVLRGETPPAEILTSVTRFKLGFSGDVMILPELYEYVKNPILRLGTVHFLPRVRRIPVIDDFLLGINHAS